MSNEIRLTSFEIGCISAVVLLLSIGVGSFFAARAPLMPGPVVLIRTPLASPLKQNDVYAHMPRHFLPLENYPHAQRNRHHHVCNDECVAYRKAYANAHRANVLLGRHQYREHA